MEENIKFSEPLHRFPEGGHMDTPSEFGHFAILTRIRNVETGKESQKTPHNHS